MSLMTEDALATYLNTLSCDESYRVHQTIKNGDHETTELVFFAGKDGAELGPFVRKRIDVNAGLGQVYRELFTAQKTGKRFLHVPRVFDVHERDNELIVIMEYVEGRTLQDEISARNASLDLAIEMFSSLCDGVIELHEGLPFPLIHRDLKPTNIIVNDHGLTIIDFGIARVYQEDAELDTTQFGTRDYAPPEQFGYAQTDVRSDIYALGMILDYLLEGQNPNQKLVLEGFPSLVSYPKLRTVVKKATAFDPTSRYKDVREFKQAFLKASEQDRRARTKEVSKSRELQETPSEPRVSKPPSTKTSVSNDSKIKASASEKVGLIWDVVVALLWLVLMVSFIVIPIKPPEGTLPYPTWFLALEFIGFGGFFITGIAYGLLDKRWLRRHISFMRSQSYGRSWIIASILLLVAVIFLVVAVFIVYLTNNFGIVR